MSKKRILPAELPQLLQELNEGDHQTQRDILRRLCPCRSRCYEGEAWLAIFHVYYTSQAEEVRNQAEHAIETLRQFSAVSARAEELVRWLAEAHSLELPDKEPKPAARRKPVKINIACHLPQLVAALEGTDSEAQCNALQQLCPCRNRCYDKAVWLKIFELRDSTSAPRVRDQANHAIDTLLRERVRIDPRSRDLVRWLREQRVLPHATPSPIRVVPTYAMMSQENQGAPVAAVQPDLQIPVWERSRRSKTNRRR
ncbi:MAG: hypothetical protein JO316_14505 [Abitibacteriaceae bacterium]|nr:hypothetical protein [Abditibacteriaceae bacterium]MBV9866562.1 hypothetical protein [Abditibacteriaceae bacterium]